MKDRLAAAESLPNRDTFRLHAWRETARLSMLVMEAAWIALAYTAFSRLGQPVSYAAALGVLGGGLIAAHLTALALGAWRIRAGFRRAALGVLLLAWVWAGCQLLLPAGAWISPGTLLGQTLGALFYDAMIPGRFWAIVVILLVWLRGVRLAAYDVEGHTILRSFQAGMLALAAVAVLAPRVLQTELLVGTFLFAAFGLAGLAASRIYSASSQPSGRQMRLRRSWALGLGGVVLGVVAAGFLLSAVFPSELVRLAGQVLLALLLVVLGGLAFLTGLLAEMLIRLLQRFNYSGSLEEYSQMIANMTRQLPEPQETLSQAAPGDPLRLGLTIGILLVLAVLVVLALRWNPLQERRILLEENEDLQSDGDFAAALQARLQSGIDSLRRRVGGASASQLLAAARVRWIYSRLMTQASRLGMPRPAAVTPLEYLPGLAEVFPNHDPDLSLITRAYLAVRYGELPEDPAQVAAVDAAWERVRGAGRKRAIPSN